MLADGKSRRLLSFSMGLKTPTIWEPCYGRLRPPVSMVSSFRIGGRWD